jgi:hypothetical protein
MYFASTKANRLQHIVQRQSNDCTIATAAMIAGVPYEMAAARSPVPVGTRGLWPSEILESVTGVSWLGPQFAWWRPIRCFSFTSCPLVVVIRRPWKWETLHCVAVYNGFVYDPGFGCPLSMSEYSRQHWRVVSVYRPAAVERLMKVWQYHRSQNSGMRLAIRRRTRRS